MRTTRLRLIVPQANGFGTRIFLDDKELKGVTAIDLKIRLDQPNEATISFIPDSVNFEGEVDAAGQIPQEDTPCVTKQ